MATESFYEDLYVRDADKCNEILLAMTRPRDINIVSSQPPKLPPNANDIWFKCLEKQND